MNAGYKRVKVDLNGVTRVCYAWFPTEAPEVQYNYGQVYSNVAEDAEPAEGEHPLLIYCHGDNGRGTVSIFITEHLARRGYVVLATDHDDSGTPKFTTPQTWSETDCFNRKEDVSALIDKAPELFAVTDQVGFIGHSLGGYTGLAMSGAIEAWHDVRIKAFLGCSPYHDPLRHIGDFSRISIPVMLQGGTMDIGVTPQLLDLYSKLKKPKYLVTFRKAGHFAWTNPTCSAYASSEECISQSGNVAGLITQFADEFIDRHVKGEVTEEPAERFLPGIGRYVFEP